MTVRRRNDSGNVSLLMVLMMPALVVSAGLVLDGGRQIETRREAHGAAAAAARAAVQLGPSEVFARQLDAGLAVGRAQRSLSGHGASGSVSVAGEAVTVKVTARVDYVILPGGKTVTQSSRASPVDGVTG
ncbi:MAG: hypothetical protein H0W46_12475, partial [Acidimicrobiia bacterium]|nr:hypothetical protein [Acidimicrobiia bacterium]